MISLTRTRSTEPESCQNTARYVVHMREITEMFWFIVYALDDDDDDYDPWEASLTYMTMHMISYSWTPKLPAKRDPSRLGEMICDSCR